MLKWYIFFMANDKILCEVVAINGDKSVCSGPGKTQLGAKFIIGPVTPQGMCSRSFTSLSATILAMRFTDKLPWEHNKDYFDTPCPDNVVTYRLTRIKEE